MKWTNKRDLEKLRNACKHSKPFSKKKNKNKKKKTAKPLNVFKTFNSYKEYLLSPTWKTIRKRILERANYKCEVCKIQRAFQVHHKTYRRLYNEKDSDLIAICGVCHQDKHNILTDEYIEKRVNDLMEQEGYK